MLPLEDLTVDDLLRRTVERFRDNAAVWYNGKYWSYDSLLRETDRYAAALVKCGVRKGDHVGFWAEIEPEVLFAFYAVQRIGAVAVMINTSLVDDEILALLEQTDVKYLLAGKSFKTLDCIARGHEGILTAPCLCRSFTIGENTLPGTESLTALSASSSREEIEAAAVMEGNVTPQDTAVILFTSGSTSMPKSVMSSHYSRVNSGIQQASDLLCTEKDRFCVTMPVFHCFCISVNLMAALSVGACVCIPKDRHIGSILDTIEACGCTVMSSVPTMFRAMLSGDKAAGRDLHTLRIGFIGGAGCTPEDFVRIDSALGEGFTLMSSLGQTECTAGLTTCRADDPIEVRARTVGHFMNYVEGKITDVKTGLPLPEGQLGEICVRGYLVMQGYYKRPDLTKNVIDDEGFVHTGDLGVLDSDGNLTLSGRLKELIIRGGENISPAEIEAVLNKMEGVDISKAVGVPDAHYGEEICACIVPESGRAPSEESIRSFLSEHLAPYKIPRYILFFDSLPVTATGKIKPTEVRQLAIRRLTMQHDPKEAQQEFSAQPGAKASADTAAFFQPAETKRASEIIYDQIREKIISGSLKPGDRLPNEKELTELFKRSRPTVREALRTLEKNGYIHTTPGSGGPVILKRSDINIGPIMEEAVLSGTISLQEMSEYRATCESASASWAAFRRTSEDLAKIRNILDQMKDSMDQISRFSRLDQEFHLSVAMASHNKVSAMITRSMGAVNSGFLEDKIRLLNAADQQKMCQRIYSQHLDIYNGIAERNSAAAKRAMKEHLKGFQNDLRTDTEFV